MFPRHHLWVLPFFLTCFSFVKDCQSQGLSVIGPKLIRPGSKYTVALSNSLPEDVQLRIRLKNGTGTLHQQETLLSKVSATTVSFNVGDFPPGDYMLTVDSLDNTFSQRIDLKYADKTMSVFIQTDKPVYKPGDWIRFRVVVVDVDTRPVKNIQTISVGLTDDEGQSISQWLNARLHKGVFESAVQLPSTPNLGSWTLTVTTKEGKTEKHVEVQKYVLPKFSVVAVPSKVLLAGDKEISITVKCQYTFGEPVDGTATVDLYLSGSSNEPKFSETKPMTGATTFAFKFDDKVKLIHKSTFGYVEAKIRVMEKFSNRTVSISQKIPVQRAPFEVSLLPSKPSFYPGAAFPVKISVKDHLSQSPVDPNPVEIIVRITGANYHDEIQLEEELDDEGIASFMLNPPKAAELLSFNVKYDSVTYNKEIRAYQSESNHYIVITLDPQSNVKPNENVVFDVSCSERISHFFYVVVVRGSIIASNIVASNKKKFTYKLLTVMSPEARIIVFYTSRGHLIYDDLVLHFDEFQNDFSLQLDKQQYRPGKEIFVQVQAAKDSFVALQAIDQSVLLIGEDTHSFTRDDVLKELSLYGTPSTKDGDHFSTMGLFLKSTAKIATPVGAGHANRDRRNRRSIQPTDIRKDFPESWLWVNHTMTGKRTDYEFSDIVPDTITSWYVSGFALSPTLGLGVVRQPVKLEVRRPFFLVVNLPYSIKRGEVALIQVTVFNFLGNTITSDVTLFNKNDEIEFVEQSSNDNTTRTKAAIVQTNNGKPTYFMIRAKKLGEIGIKVQARNSLTSDAVEHVLRVTPESKCFNRNTGNYVEFIDGPVQTFEHNLDIPQDIDEGSVKMKLTVDPDLLGKPIQNLGHLLRLPTGCGEQSMVNFVPNIVILDYLTETKSVSEKLKTDAIHNLKCGYVNQLTYKKSDGSFSFWSRTSGSTFITAFVAKSFKIAGKYIGVDKQIMERAFQWLARIQKPDGQFDELSGTIITQMQGGMRSKSFALTAYVLIAFTEDEDIAKQYKSVITKTMSYLASNFPKINDPYDLALASYAMALGKHPDRTKFFNKLLESSISNRNASIRYWNRSPVNVEIAGYALLTYIENGEFNSAAPVMRWLNQHRYDRGGYSGTQDTFVGLKALAKYAAKLSKHRSEYQVNIKYNSRTAQSFKINQQNSMIITEHDIPDNVRQVQVDFNGVGHGYFQIAYQYCHKITEGKQSFDLQIEVLPSTSYYEQHLKVCAAYIPTDKNQRTGMALVEVFLPSGMMAETDAVEDLSANREIRKTELRFGATSVVVYYDSLGAQSMCFKVKALRKHKVALQLPAYVEVYDYYDKDRFAIKEYQGRVLNLCDICENEDCDTLQC